VLHWCCTGAALVLHWCCTGAALVLHWCCTGCCTGAALVLHWCCTGAALVLHWCCTGAALVLHGAALVLHWCCTGAALVLHWCCTGAALGAALVLHWCCTGAALVLHWCCTGAALVLHWCNREQEQDHRAWHFARSTPYRPCPFSFLGFCLGADLWAMGAIMAELFTLRPLFPGARYRHRTAQHSNRRPHPVATDVFRHQVSGRSRVYLPGAGRPVMYALLSEPTSLFMSVCSHAVRWTR